MDFQLWRPNTDSSMNRLETVWLPRRVPKAKPEPRQPQVVELLRKAREWKLRLEVGTASSRAALGRQVGASGQRVGHLVWLATRISPEPSGMAVPSDTAVNSIFPCVPS